MAYEVKFPLEDGGDRLTGSRLSNLHEKSGDTGDGGDGAGPAVPNPSSCPPLPRGVRLVRYQPKTPPVAIQVVSIANDIDKFLRHYLRELDARLNSPVQIRGGGSVFEILDKLAEVGVELAIETPPREDVK
jgi:hypothetical protein